MATNLSQDCPRPALASSTHYNIMSNRGVTCRPRYPRGLELFLNTPRRHGHFVAASVWGAPAGARLYLMRICFCPPGLRLLEPGKACVKQTWTAVKAERSRTHSRCWQTIRQIFVACSIAYFALMLHCRLATCTEQVARRVWEDLRAGRRASSLSPPVPRRNSLQNQTSSHVRTCHLGPASAMLRQSSLPCILNHVHERA